VYVQLVTAPSQAVRDCFQGRLEGCAAALDVGASPATLETWYPSAAERRSLLIQSFGEVVVGTTLSVYPQGTVRLNNGRLVMDNFSPEGGVFDFASGSVTFSSGFTFEGFHLDGLLGAVLKRNRNSSICTTLSKPFRYRRE